jgi:hypothetical protein
MLASLAESRDLRGLKEAVFTAIDLYLVRVNPKQSVLRQMRDYMVCGFWHGPRGRVNAIILRAQVEQCLEKKPILELLAAYPGHYLKEELRKILMIHLHVNRANVGEMAARALRYTPATVVSKALWNRIADGLIAQKLKDGLPVVIRTDLSEVGRRSEAAAAAAEAAAAGEQHVTGQTQEQVVNRGASVNAADVSEALQLTT